MADLPKGKRVINKGKTQQRINLKTLLGRTPTTDEKKRFTLESIELINDRTLDGKDINGKKFTKYSIDYAKKKGVTRNSVDMFLEGDMLDDIEPLTETINTVTFGMENTLSRLKSDNHNNGVTLPKREFFGVTQKEAKRIAKDIRDKKVDVRKRGLTLAEIRAAVNQLGLEQE
jgi:hypothetical protein